MCEIRDALWNPEDLVLQFHPPRSVYVSDHAFTLHLWRDPKQTIVLPPRFFVGRYPGWEADVAQWHKEQDDAASNADPTS